VTLDQTDHRTAASATVKTPHVADTTTLKAMSDPYEREAAKAAIKVLQRELAEALEELKKANQYIATGRSWNAPDSLFAEISMLKQQRDTLAKALREIANEDYRGPRPWSANIAHKALAAVKGGQHE